jgi:hypothetical protein
LLLLAGMASKRNRSGAEVLKGITDEAGLTNPASLKEPRRKPKRPMSKRMSRYLGKARRNR